MWAIIIRIIKQMWNDKRSLALILFAPILIISFMYLVFGESSYIPKLATIDLPSQMITAIEKQDVTIITTSDAIDKILKDKTADGVLYIDNKVLKLNPDYHRAYLGIGICFDKLNKSTDATRYYKKFLAYKPNSHHTPFVKERLSRIAQSQSLKKDKSFLSII